MPGHAATRPRLGTLEVVAEDDDGFEDLDHSLPDLDADLGADFREPRERQDGGPHYSELDAEERETLRDDLQARIGAHLARGRARVLVTDNVRTMLSIKRGQGVFTFRLHHMFIDASPLVLRAVAHYAEHQERDAADLLRAFIDSNDEAIRSRIQPRPVVVDVQGRWHNLQQVFDELNARYFGAEIQARITWGSRTRRKPGRHSIKLGSYTVEDELIRIHPVLDAQDVPSFFLAWVVYHEMLHEIHDMPVVDGRRVYHTREFRRAEAQFDQYAEAVLWERTNLHRLLDR